MTQANSKSALILLAEDDKINQMVAKINLEQIGHFQVDTANNGQEAIDMASKKTYDLILMDINMPFLNGCAAAQHIRQHEHTHTPIIAMTADMITNDLQACAKVGIDDVLEKPIAKDKLEQMLDKWLVKS